MKTNVILVTSGEPGGIGPDICLDLANMVISNAHRIVVLADIELLYARAKCLNKNIKLIKIKEVEDTNHVLDKGSLYVLDIKCPNLDTLGILRVENAKYVMQILDTAITLCKEGKSRTIVTAPLSKEIINKSGHMFMGHTEYLAQAFNRDKVVMMLANNVLKVALLTTHLPLKEVPQQITKANLRETLNIIINSFNDNYRIENPRIAVCGLNPHAGEGGYLGMEEFDIINPVINEFKQNGYNVSGSYPADTIFMRSSDFDVILAMYHDQGLPVLKYSGFVDGVNITLGLPIIRTSVDHGTALDLAGSGRVLSASLINAVNYAISQAGGS